MPGAPVNEEDRDFDEPLTRAVELVIDLVKRGEAVRFHELEVEGL